MAAFGVLALRPQPPVGVLVKPQKPQAPVELTDDDVAAAMAAQAPMESAPLELTDDDVAAAMAPPPPEPLPVELEPDSVRLTEIPDKPKPVAEVESDSWLDNIPTVGGMLKGAGDYLSDAISGESRTDAQDKNTPELPFAPARSITLGLAMGDQQKLEILRARYPSIKAYRDKFDNVLIDVNQEHAADMGVRPGRYFLNKPGVSVQDALDLGVMGGFAATGMGAVGGTSRAIAGSGIIGQLATGGAGMAAGSLARNATADVAGADPDYLRDAAIEGALGAGFALPGALTGYASRALVKPGLAKIGRALGVTRTPQFAVGDDLTKEGAAFMEKTGVDPRDLTPEAQKHMQSLIDQSVDQSVAARAASAKSLPHEVPLSKGDVTQDVAEQRFEESARQGMFGDSPKARMDEFRARQQEAIQNNAETIAGRIGSPQGRGVSAETITQEPGALGQRHAVGAPTATSESAAADLRLRLAAIRDAAKTNYKDAYATARESQAHIHGGRGFAQRARESVSDFNPKLTKDAGTMLDELDTIIADAGDRPVDLRVLEQWLQQVNNAARGADPANAAALVKIKRTYGAYLDDALESGRVVGDQKAIYAWKNARALRRDFAQKFESDPNIGKMLELASDGSMAFKSTPSEVVNLLLSGNGLVGKKGSAQTLGKVMELLDPKSPEVRQLKQAFFWRLLQTGNEMARGGEKVNISGQKMFGLWSDAWRKNPEFIRTLFTPDEIKTINAYVNIARLATSRQNGAVNYSGTAYVTRGLDLLLGQNTSIGRMALGPIAKFFRYGQGDIRTIMATQGPHGVVSPHNAADFYTATKATTTRQQLEPRITKGGE